LLHLACAYLPWQLAEPMVGLAIVHGFCKSRESIQGSAQGIFGKE
jgi:hypothetical protein